MPSSRSCRGSTRFSRCRGGTSPPFSEPPPSALANTRIAIPECQSRPCAAGRNSMTDAFIFDHVRTPRGRGKPDGSLHTASTLHLAATALKAIKDRNNLDPVQVDDVVLGCVDPVGEAGGDIARMGALAAGFGDTVPGVQINRFCAAQVMSGQHDLTIGGGVESMSRVGIGASGGAWPVDPSIAIPAYFMPQG